MTAALSLGSIAKALGGEVSGRQILAPGPGHSPRDRSLSVRVDPNAPDGVLVHSFAADDWRACRDHVKARLGAPSRHQSVAQSGSRHSQRSGTALRQIASDQPFGAVRAIQLFDHAPRGNFEGAS